MFSEFILALVANESLRALLVWFGASNMTFSIIILVSILVAVAEKEMHACSLNSDMFIVDAVKLQMFYFKKINKENKETCLWCPVFNTS